MLKETTRRNPVRPKKKQPRALSLVRWFDTWAEQGNENVTLPVQADWLRTLPFIGMHLMCGCVIWVGWSTAAVMAAVALYVIRMFAITGFYHRYFSHRAFKTSRGCQFVFALLGATAVQRGPLWWAGHHRRHHSRSDQIEDAHSPIQHGFLWSHMGWFTAPAHFSTNLSTVKDFARYPELCILDRFDTFVALGFLATLYALGTLCEFAIPGLGLTGSQLVVWGFFISTVMLYHATYTINSLAHRFGRQRYRTNDQSRNNWLLALLTLGEGWHNNHHYYPATARQGFYWWEIDVTYYLLLLLSRLGLIWDLRPLSVKRREQGQLRRTNTLSLSGVRGSISR